MMVKHPLNRYERAFYKYHYRKDKGRYRKEFSARMRRGILSRVRSIFDAVTNTTINSSRRIGMKVKTMNKKVKKEITKKATVTKKAVTSGAKKVKKKSGEIKRATKRVAQKTSSRKPIKKAKEVKPALREKRSPKKPKKKKRSWFKRIILFGLFVLLLLFGLFFIWFASLEIPDVDNFKERKISNSTKIYDKTGEVLLYDIHEDIRRTVVGFDGINQYAKDAIVAVEDHTFYEHKGVVWKSTLRAVMQTLASKVGLPGAGAAGGSTLTQQVVKNTLLTRERTITRKVKEWVLAYKLERELNKNEILAVYLNEAPYGGAVYGIEEASNIFFGKSAQNITLAEAAYLAAIPNLPTFYSPYGPNKDALDRRQRIVLQLMKQHGYISQDLYNEALEEDVEFLPRANSFGKALHFVQYIRAQLEEKYGTDVVENGGLKVITTLDYALQQKAEEIIKEHVEDVEDKYDASNAALVAIENETGQIITMVGSKDYFDTEGFDGNFNVAIAPRQPGSSFKPFGYAAAFEKGYLPETAIFDVETQFNSACDPDDLTSKDNCYAPGNHDARFFGPMNLRTALAQSRNIPAIKMLYLAGVSDVINYAREMGITSLNERPSFYGLNLVLGGGEVSLLEMVGAYTTFPNDGEYVPTTGIISVTDSEGLVLEEYIETDERVFSKNTARMISSILSDNVARSPLFGSNSFLYFGGKDVAGKTGTTNDNRDAWLIGYTSDVSVGVWTGNNNNAPMKRGSSISGKPWNEYMNEIIDEYKEKDFKDYELPEDMGTYPGMIQGRWQGGEIIYIDSVSGKLATEFTPEETKVAIPNIDPHTILHFIDKKNPRLKSNLRTDDQYPAWEFAVNKYVQENLADQLGSPIEIPTEYDDVHTADSSGQAFDFEIEGIASVSYELDEEVEVELDPDGVSKNDIELVQYSINNVFVAALEDTLDFSFVPGDIGNITQSNVLTITMVDEDFNKSTQSITFEVNLSEEL